MKQILLYGIYIVGVMLVASCSADDSVLTPVAERTDSITVTLSIDKAALSRAAGNPALTDGNISTLLIAAFDNAGNLVTTSTKYYAANGIYSFNTTEATTQLMVIANSGINSMVIHDKTDLIAQYNLVLSAANSSAIPMVGTADISITENQQEPVEVNIALMRLMSRVVVTNISVDASAHFTPTEIFMMNVNEKHALYDATALWQGRNYTSLTATNGATGETGESGAMAFLSSGSSFAVPQTADNTTWQYFHVYPHEAENATRLVIKGTYTDPQTDQQSTMYYPVIVNHVYASITEGENQYTYAPYYPNDSRLEANKSYAMSISITGEGVSTPEEEVTVNHALYVTMTVSDYADVSQTTVIDATTPTQPVIPLN